MLFLHDKHTHKKPIASRFFVHRLADYALRFSAVYLAATSPAYAFDQIEKTLSMKDAITRSLSQHPELVSFSYRMTSAEGDIQYAAVGQKPELSLVLEDAFGTGEYSGFDQAKSTLGCSGLIEPDTLMRDNKRQLLRCQYESET